MQKNTKNTKIPKKKDPNIFFFLVRILKKDSQQKMQQNLKIFENPKKAKNATKMREQLPKKREKNAKNIKNTKIPKINPKR